MPVETESDGAKAAVTDPRYKQAQAIGAGDKGREMLEHVVQGATLNAAEEASALDYLLGTPAAGVFTIDVEIDTPVGRAPATFVVQSQDGAALEKAETLHRDANTGLLQQLPASAAIVSLATLKLVDAAHPAGINIRTDAKWLTMVITDALGNTSPHKFADPGEALLRRFTGQQGLLLFVAQEIRRVSGYDEGRVSQSKRKLVAAALD